jgi:hypothetical protein
LKRSLTPDQVRGDDVRERPELLSSLAEGFWDGP